MNYLLFDDESRNEFLPLVFTRPVSELLFGTSSITEKWSKRIDGNASHLTSESLSGLFPSIIEDQNVLINGRCVPDNKLAAAIVNLEQGQAIVKGDVLIALHCEKNFLKDKTNINGLDSAAVINSEVIGTTEYEDDVLIVNHIWDFFTQNAQCFDKDMEVFDKSMFKGQAIHNSQIISNEVFIHNTAKVSASILNSESGPIVIDEGAEVMEGSVIRGPFYLGKGSAVKMGAKIYGAASIGEQSKVGGEINNSVVNSFSNKAHDGFLGNSVIGQWCNLGADTNNSNLKNDYSEVKLWNYPKGSFTRSSLQFLGLIMGDHSKCGINTMFNTGTVVGVSCNVYGAAFQPNFIPSFSWGKPGDFTEYHFPKAMKVAQSVMSRRSKELTEADEKVLKSVFEQSAELRQKFHKPS